ncbi:MAG: hypothetical protein JRI34_02265 [Deltaproteobacteria bacterium]|nr:hypothetical protein [Deltaproteobacteria bacterium]
MRRQQEGSTQARTFEAIKAAGEITIRGLQEALGLPGSKGYARISHATQDLVRAGYIKRTSPATYKFVRGPRDLDYSQAQKRMVRIVRIRTRRHEAFTARILSELSGCSLDWAKRYISFLLKSGYLERVGYTRTGPKNSKAAAYLGVEERLNDEWPAMRRRAKTSELDEAVARVKALAFRVAREVVGTRESLRWASGYMQGMVDIIEEALSENNKK